MPHVPLADLGLPPIMRILSPEGQPTDRRTPMDPIKHHLQLPFAAPGAGSVGHRGPEQHAAVPYQRTREMTLDELMLENRVVFLVGEINHASGARVMMQMLYLEDQKRGQDINFYINSPGGSVDDTLAIYDTMSFISSDVATFCIGRAYSGGAVLLAAGTPGKRHILPHAKVMIHQPWGGVTGQTTDIQIQAEQIIKAKRTLNEILAKHTGQPIEHVQRDSERDKFFTAEEAKTYGLVDTVFTPPERKKDEKK
jgi:ATP-dependent Clp protease, protease subunit